MINVGGLDIVANVAVGSVGAKDVYLGDKQVWPPTVTQSGYFQGGSHDYLTAPTSDAFNVGSGPYTIEAFVYPLSWSNLYVPIFRNSSSGGITFSKAYHKSGMIVNVIGRGDVLSCASQPSLNVWSHVAAVRDASGNAAIFINGQRQVLGSYNNVHTGGEAFIGGYKDSVNGCMNGYLSNVRISRVAVYDPLQTAFTVPTVGLLPTHDTSLLTLQTGLTDVSKNKFPLSVSGNVTLINKSPF